MFSVCKRARGLTPASAAYHAAEAADDAERLKAFLSRLDSNRTRNRAS
jgi:hypothetical protein